MVALQSTWTWLPAIYLFLGGLAGGAFLTVGIMYLAKPERFKKTISAGVWIAAIALALGLLCLVSEVENPLKAVVLWKAFTNTASWMTIGAWLLFTTMVVYVLAIIFMTNTFFKKEGKPGLGRRIVGILVALIGMVLSLGVAVYTGILLGAAPAVPFWNMEKLPVLFTISAVDTGIAAVMIAMCIRENLEEVRKGRVVLEICTVLLILAEAYVVWKYMTFMQAAGGAAATSVTLLTEGPLSFGFWGLFLIVGLAIPLVIAIVGMFLGAPKKAEDGETAKAKGLKTVKIVAIAGAACALIGGFVLRYIMIKAGIHEPILSPDYIQAITNSLIYLG